MIRHLAAAGPPVGLVVEVYAQIKRDFGLVPEPMTLHAPVPALAAGFWMIYRESAIAGRVPRVHTEAVAAAVSAANRCPYCVDAHTMVLHGAGAHGLASALAAGGAVGNPTVAALVAWAAASPFDRPSAPFDAAKAPELIGTAVCFHYVNRMVSALLASTPFPVRGARGRAFLRRAMGLVVSRSVRRAKVAGESLRFLPEAPLPRDLGWAAGSAAVAGAFARFAHAVEVAGADALGPATRARAAARIAAWRGDTAPLSRSWMDSDLDDLPPPARAETRLALLAALAPWQVDDAVVHAYRAVHGSDAALVSALAWGAFLAARRIGVALAGR